MRSSYLFTRKDLFYKWTGIIIVLIFFVTFLLRVTYLPNHLIFLLLGSLLLSLLYLPLFLFVGLRNLGNRIPVWGHIAGLLFCFLLVWELFIWHVVPMLQVQFRMMPFTQAQMITAVAVTGVVAVGYLSIFLIRNTTSDLKAEGWYFFIVYTLSIVFTAMSFPLLIQAPDRLFDPDTGPPAYPRGEGPLIYIDQGHHNFHTLDDRLITTGRILRKDGYIVKAYKGNIDRARLRDCNIFMIVNALNEENESNWANPTYSAFTSDEIDNLHDWVAGGGALLLVADHMPMPGAVAGLAKRFGFELENGHAGDTVGLPDYFTRAQGTLAEDLITNGRSAMERVDSILTFSGHAFRIPAESTSFMTFDERYFQWNPGEAWRMDGVEPYPVKGYSQGAYREYGNGRVVILGEAMMITAQLGAGLSRMKMGMNSPAAPYNYRLLLNIIHWLDGMLT